MREKIEALKHHAKILAHGVDIVFAACDVLAFYINRSLVHVFKAIDGAQAGRLA